MKKYLSFHLKGEEIFALIIVILLVVAIPSVFFAFNKYRDLIEKPEFLPLISLSVGVLIMFVIVLILGLLILKKSIESVEFNDARFVFEGLPGEYLLIILKGIFLTIITIGIYAPWFQKDLTAYYVGKTKYTEKNFSFHGKGGDLFVIIIAGVAMPLIIVGLIFGWETFEESSYSSFKAYGMNILQTILLSPFVYFYYRWIVNVKFDNFHALIDSNKYEGISVVLVQTLLAAITFGIYFPLAGLKIYKYYLNHIVVSGEDGDKIHFEYDMEETEDFLFIWGQTLLSVITIGIYIPWAYCRIMERVLGKTSMAIGE